MYLLQGVDGRVLYVVQGTHTDPIDLNFVSSLVLPGGCIGVIGIYLEEEVFEFH